MAELIQFLFDNDSGSTATNDGADSLENGTWNGTPVTYADSTTLTGYASGNGVKPDGASTRINLTPSNYVNKANFTLGFWIDYEASGNVRPFYAIQFPDEFTAYGYYLNVYNGTLYVIWTDVGQNSQNISVSIPVSGCHIFVTWDATNFKIFVDNNATADVTSSNTTIAQQGANPVFYTAYYNSNNPILLDDLIFHDVVLDANAKTFIYEGYGLVVNETNMVTSSSISAEGSISEPNEVSIVTNSSIIAKAQPKISSDLIVNSSIVAQVSQIAQATITARASIYGLADAPYVYRLIKGSPLTDNEITNNFAQSLDTITPTPVAVGGVITNYDSSFEYRTTSDTLVVLGDGTYTGTGILWAKGVNMNISKGVLIT